MSDITNRIKALKQEQKEVKKLTEYYKGLNSELKKSIKNIEKLSEFGEEELEESDDEGDNQEEPTRPSCTCHDPPFLDIDCERSEVPEIPEDPEEEEEDEEEYIRGKNKKYKKNKTKNLIAGNAIRISDDIEIRIAPLSLPWGCFTYEDAFRE